MPENRLSCMANEWHSLTFYRNLYVRHIIMLLPTTLKELYIRYWNSNSIRRKANMTGKSSYKTHFNREYQPWYVWIIINLCRSEILYALCRGFFQNLDIYALVDRQMPAYQWGLIVNSVMKMGIRGANRSLNMNWKLELSCAEGPLFRRKYGFESSLKRSSRHDVGEIFRMNLLLNWSARKDLVDKYKNL